MASSSSSSPLYSAPSSQLWKHDVFLSFRGKDTRKTFVGHLYKSLVQQGINTYKDDETLRQGESIGTSLIKAIEDSHMAIIVFSKGYADSSWCLDELAHIMKCKDTRGQIVIPIFYDVDPSTVQKQIFEYGEAFAKHEFENKAKVEFWKKVLVDTSNLSGWVPENIANGHESKAIKEIVDKISSRLQLVNSNESENLVGIAARVHGLKSELQIGSGGVRMVGIWGVGGGGKTTLASSIYDEISIMFDGCCFVENIREKSSRQGLETLQEKILSKMEANNIGGGRCLISKRLRYRKVLIVLDDVNHLDQLKSLVGSPDWFGEGSRIIITTRDEHLLNAHKVVVYAISLLNGDEAIKLFRKHAPRGSIPMEDYEQLSKEVVFYAGGLPLALTVIGSSLCDKNIHQWRSALARLKEIPDNNILEKLEISFNGLKKVQQDLFLDIACFFRGNNKDHAMEILDACGFHPVIGVEELRQKALITISSYGNFDMHDLVQEMGHYIVRGKHPKNPEKHSRVWKKDDILTICAMDATMELDTTEAIQADLNFLRPNNPPPIVANMKKIRYIHWKGHPTNPLDINFPPKELCCLILHDAIYDQLWDGYKKLPNLKMIELWYLDNLITTPNFDGLPNLERFVVIKSPKLKEIDSSLGRLANLVSLHIKQCPRIKMFPSITKLKKLKTLSFRASPGLFELSEIQQNTDNLPHLHVECCLPHNNMNPIRFLFFYIDLRKLDLSWCKLGDENISSAVWELPNLQELDLSGNKFSRLNFGLIRTPRLKLLMVGGCGGLVELSELPSSIAVVNANYCSLLETFGDISNCKWLWKVLLIGADKVGPLNGYIIVDSMLKGNALEDHRITVSLQHQIPKGFLGSLFRSNTFTLHLPHDWYNNFCGFLIHVVTLVLVPVIDIVIKQEVDEDSRFELREESDEELQHEYGRTQTFVGYVSFNSLGHISGLNSTYNVISISRQFGSNSVPVYRIAAELVPRKSKGDPVQATKFVADCSEFLDEEDHFRPTFTIEHDLKPSIKIKWIPNH